MKKWIIRSRARRGIWMPDFMELSREAEADILLAFHAAHRAFGSEVSGLGRVEQKGASFVVSGVIIPNQVCYGIGTTFDGQELDSIFQELEKEGKDPRQYNFWWHSHVEGSASFSHIDTAMIKRRLLVMLSGVHLRYLALGEEVPDETMAGPFVALVGNVFGEMTVRCDFVYRKESEENRKESYWYISFTVPLIRHLSLMSEDDRNELFGARAKIIVPMVQARVRAARSDYEDDPDRFTLDELIRRLRKRHEEGEEE